MGSYGGRYLWDLLWTCSINYFFFVISSKLSSLQKHLKYEIIFQLFHPNHKILNVLNSTNADFLQFEHLYSLMNDLYTNQIKVKVVYNLFIFLRPKWTTIFPSPNWSIASRPRQRANSGKN